MVPLIDPTRQKRIKKCIRSRVNMAFLVGSYQAVRMNDDLITNVCLPPLELNHDGGCDASMVYINNSIKKIQAL